MNFLIVQHHDISPPGLIGERILARGARYDLYRPIDGYASTDPAGTTPLPTTDGDYGGLVILGGPMDAFDDAGYPHYRRLFALIDAFERHEKPVLGLCLGGQLIARAHGAEVRRMADLELGFVEVTALPAAARDPLFAGLPPTIRLMQWHQDRFDLPAAATPLLGGAFCPHQAFRAASKTYGFQPHPEASFEMIRSWIFEGRASLPPARHQELARLEQELALYYRDTAAIGTTLFDRWLDLAQ